MEVLKWRKTWRAMDAQGRQWSRPIKYQKRLEQWRGLWASNPQHRYGLDYCCRSQHRICIGCQQGNPEQPRQTEVSKGQCLTGKYEWKEDGYLSLRRFKDSIGVWTEFAQWGWSLESRNGTIPETELQGDYCGHWKWGWIVTREACGKAWLGRCYTS